MKKVNRNYAPKGYHAVADKSERGCVGCAFESARECNTGRECASSERPDDRDVIFIANKVTPTVKFADLKEVVETLERVGCQFWACDGPYKRPVHMKTCYVCETLHDLYKRYPELKKK